MKKINIISTNYMDKFQEVIISNERVVYSTQYGRSHTTRAATHHGALLVDTALMIESQQFLGTSGLEGIATYPAERTFIQLPCSMHDLRCRRHTGGRGRHDITLLAYHS